MSQLIVDSVKKSYSPAGPVVLDGVTLKVGEGEFVAVVGPSGCGKTTLLMCISGLIPFEEGEVTVDGRPLTGPPPDMAVVFQDYSRSLLPWLTVRSNVELPLRVRGVPAAERREKAVAELARVGLVEAADMYPWQLSGGMQQRVAIARALAVSPSILLMDEPFASVDAQTRMELEDLVLHVWQSLRPTVLFVTHDIDESVYLSDRVLVLGRRSEATEHPVDLARPRHQIETRSHPRYVEVRNRVLREIMPEPPLRHLAAASRSHPSSPFGGEPS